MTQRNPQDRLAVLIDLRTRREEQALAALAATTRQCHEAETAVRAARQHYQLHCLNQEEQEKQLLENLAHTAFTQRDVQRVDEKLGSLSKKRQRLEADLHRLDEQHAIALLKRSEALELRNQRWKSRVALTALYDERQRKARHAQEQQAEHETEEHLPARNNS
jgi:tRNA U54 and U55 pseudouridine synthase Pus10